MQFYLPNLKKYLRKPKQKVAIETATPTDKRTRVAALVLVILIVLSWLFFTFYDGEFMFKEEGQLDTITYFIFIPLLVVVAIGALAAKSFKALISAIIVCCLLVYPPLEGIIMFMNVKIGEQIEETVDGIVIGKDRSGNKVITIHYKVKTTEGREYTFETTWKEKKYEVNDQFNYIMKKGFFGILYRKYRK